MRKLDDTTPVTLIYKELDKEIDETLSDSVAALALLPEDAPELLKEKAVAAVSFMNNETMVVSEPHAFANICLIFNGVPAVVDYLPQVSVQYINYAIWEIKQIKPSIALQPAVVNYVKACLLTEDFIIPPKYLQFIEYYFIEQFGEEALEVDKFYDAYEKNTSASEDLEKLDDFKKFHISKLLQVDAYTEKMIKIYKDFSEGKKE